MTLALAAALQAGSHIQCMPTQIFEEGVPGTLSIEVEVRDEPSVEITDQFWDSTTRLSISPLAAAQYIFCQQSRDESYDFRNFLVSNKRVYRIRFSYGDHFMDIRLSLIGAPYSRPTRLSDFSEELIPMIDYFRQQNQSQRGVQG